MSSSNKSHYIFELIKSMTQTEKRYFKMFVSVFEQKNKTYLKLYNAIDKQNSYDEKALKKKFANESFITHFAVVKNKLYNAILKSLRFYHTDSHPVEMINHYKNNYVLLSRKGLPDLAAAQLTKAMKIAEENNLITETLLLTSWRNNNLMRNVCLRDLKLDIEAELDAPLKQIKIIEDYHKSVNIKRKIELFHHKGLVRTKKSHKTLLDWINDPFLVEDYKSLSIAAQKNKIEAKISCYVSLKDYRKAKPLSKKLLGLLMVQTDNASTVGNFFNYIYISLRIDSWNMLDDKIQECLILFNELNKNKKIFFDNERRQYDLQFHAKLEHSLFHGKFNNIKNILPKTIEKYHNLKKDISPLYFWIYNYQFAYAYFVIGDFEEAQQYLIKLLNASVLKNRKDYYIATHILNLFNHYELGNHEHLSYQIKNTKELIKRQDYYFEFEKICIDFLSKLCKTSKDNKKDLLQKYHAKFTNLSKNTWELDAFEKFDILWWIKERIINKNLLTSQKLGKKEHA